MCLGSFKKNLENLNLVELNAREVQETEGGWAGIVVKVLRGLALAAGIGAAVHDQVCDPTPPCQ